MMDEIIATKELLEKELKRAAATMEKKNDLQEIKRKIQENQERCPHFDNNYNFTWVDDTCPYCGKKHALGGEIL